MIYERPTYKGQPLSDDKHWDDDLDETNEEWTPPVQRQNTYEKPRSTVKEKERKINIEDENSKLMEYEESD